ncbi:MAG: response regulator [Planctomycetota bacterium]
MKTRWLQLFGIIAFCAITITIYTSLPVRQDIVLALACFMCFFMTSAAAYSYYRVKKKISRLQDIISAIPYGIFWKDTNSVYQGCNEQFAKTVGAERPEEIIGKSDYDLPWKTEQAACFIECDRDIVKTSKPLVNMKGTLLDAAGNTLYVVTDKVPLRNADGKITGILGIYTDVTKPKNADKNPDAESPKSSEASSDSADRAVQKAKDDEDGHPREVKQEADDDAKPNILVVDDVPENRMLLEILLTKAGYGTRMCCDGKEAVELASSEKFALILMDIRMPVMDGLEATKIIKSKGLNLQTPVIAMTADNKKGDEMVCFEAGCDAYIAKPIERTVLLDKIEMFLHQTRQFEAADRGEDIVSVLAENPSYYDMIDMFVNNLPKRLEDMQLALDEKNLQDLAFQVHALKGLGGFAGFPIYTEKARSLERSVRENQIDQMRRQLDEMVRLCQKTKLSKR